MIQRIDVVGVCGTPIRALYIPEGDTDPISKEKVKEDVIQFYDTRYNHTPDGQFISEYYLRTLYEAGDLNRGLNLQGDIDPWKLNGRTITMVFEWSLYHVYQRTKRRDFEKATHPATK